MSDIVERIRMRQLPVGGTFELMDDAAVEIGRLRVALNEIRGCPDWYTATKIACSALTPATSSRSPTSPSPRTKK